MRRDPCPTAAKMRGEGACLGRGAMPALVDTSSMRAKNRSFEKRQRTSAEAKQRSYFFLPLNFTSSCGTLFPLVYLGFTQLTPSIGSSVMCPSPHYCA